jgi:hypothetical protein
MGRDGVSDDTDMLAISGDGGELQLGDVGWGVTA